MEDTNGSLKAPKPLNGVNGGLKSTLNGHAVGPRTRRAAVAGPGFLARGFSIMARLLTWYSILTILFRCPTTLTDCDEHAPRICKPYFRLKQVVVPRVEPYYDAYAAPYVDLARPYYGAVDKSVITPSWGYAKRYGAPRLEQAQAYAQAQWARSVQPQIVKYQQLAHDKYSHTMAPHVDQVGAVIGPYFDIARTSALQTYHEVILPSYQFVSPYAQHGYTAASAFTAETVVPVALWTWNKTYVFLDGTVWPQLRVMYVENVEPQLVKIGKRLGRYNNGKKSLPKPVVEASTSLASKSISSFIKPTSSVASNVASSSVAYTSSPAASSTPSSSLKASSGSAPSQSERTGTDAASSFPSAELVSPPETNPKLGNEDPSYLAAREVVAADLRDWQERYAKAAKDGAAEISDQVRDISRRMVRRNARIMGKSLLEQLQSTVVAELVSLRRDILQIVGALNKASATPEDAREQVTQVVRRAGLAIKERAKDVRNWRETYESEMQMAVTKSAEAHFAILQEIKDLALQKIGMKWAWTDGITYKDWEKYHQLKHRFDEWNDDLQNLIVSHPSLEAAQLEGAGIEDEAMALAANAAKELARLKQVANWKLIAGDDSQEFDSTLMQQAAEAAEAAVEAAKAAAASATVAIKDAKDAVAAQAEELVESASSAVFSQQSSESPESSPEFVVVESEGGSKPDEPVREASPEASPELVEAPNRPDLASSVILEDTPIIVGNATEPDAENASPAPIELPYEDETLVEPQAGVSLAAEELPISSATPSVKPAFLGAAAQSVPSRQPILDDDEEDEASDALESMRQDLKSVYSVAVSRANEQYSQALSVISVQIRGTPEPAHEKLLASVTAAYSNAMASASSRLDDALKLAGGKLHGTPTKRALIPTPTVPSVDWARIESVAAERLNQGKAWAEEQYESAKIAVGLATPTPSTPSEHINKLLENARHNYFAGLGVAHARYSEFLAAATSALSSMTATPTPTDFAGTMSSLGSVASESAASAASVVGESAASAASAASAGASSVVAAGYENASAAADKVAQNWDVMVSRISIEIYGAPTPTPFYASVYSIAAGGMSSATEAVGGGAAAASEEVVKQYEAVSSIVSELLIGKEPTFSESVVSRLNAAYVTGAAAASSVASAAQATAVSAVKDASQSVKSVGDKIASAASEATEAVKDAAHATKDEL